MHMGVDLLRGVWAWPLLLGGGHPSAENQPVAQRPDFVEAPVADRRMGLTFDTVQVGFHDQRRQRFQLNCE